MAEHKLSICMGNACYVKGSETLYNYAIENKPDNFEIVTVGCLGICNAGTSPVVMFDDVVYGRCDIDTIKELYDLFGTGGNADIPDIDKDEYHKCITINDVQKKGKGYIFDGQIDANKNRCITSNIFDTARNTVCSIKVKNNTGIDYEQNQLMCLNDIDTNDDTIIINVFVTNIGSNQYWFGNNGKVHLEIKDDTDTIVYHGYYSLAYLKLTAGASTNTIKFEIYRSMFDIDLTNKQYFFKVRTSGGWSITTSCYWRFPPGDTKYGHEGSYDKASANTNWIPIQPRDFVDYNFNNKVGEPYGSLFNCYGNEHWLSEFAGINNTVEIRISQE